jgi:hypothetical protein
MDDLRPTQGHRLKVLFLAGSGRNGSTLLEGIIDTSPHAAAVGELRSMADRNVNAGTPCACGQDIRSCPVWSEALRLAGLRAEAEDWHWLEELRAYSRTASWWRLVRPGARADLQERLGSSLAKLATLYLAIATVRGSDLIVDSSKYPAFGYLLTLIPQLEVHSVLLVRDPRAVCYSWMTPKMDRANGHSLPMIRLSPAKAALIWRLWNCAAPMMLRGGATFQVVHYEDLVRRPQTTVQEILSRIGRPNIAPDFSSEHVVNRRVLHTTSGNPVRFEEGPVVVREDLRWRYEMKKRDRFIVTMLTWPTLRSYGYRVRHRPFQGGASVS